MTASQSQAWALPPISHRAPGWFPVSLGALRAIGPRMRYLRVNVSSIVMMTGTGSPCRVPGMKRH